MPQIIPEDKPLNMQDEEWTASQREIISDSIKEIAARLKAVLAERGIKFPVFLLVPTSGRALLTAGTVVEPDPSDEEWEIVSSTVCMIVQDVLGGSPFIGKRIACAMAQPIAVVPELTNADA